VVCAVICEPVSTCTASSLNNLASTPRATPRGRGRSMNVRWLGYCCNPG
jgi:hypothetical protein